MIASKSDQAKYKFDLAPEAFNQLNLDRRLSSDQSGRFGEAIKLYKSESGLYVMASDAVTFLTPVLFRSSIAVEEAAPNGKYLVHIFLLKDGILVAQSVSSFELLTVGLTRFLESSAADYPISYSILILILIFGGVLAALKLMTGESLNHLRW